MKIVVNEEDILCRIDQFLAKKTDYSRAKIQSKLKNGEIFVFDATVAASYVVKLHDEITILEDTVEILLEEENIPLTIVYEDEYLLVVDKPSGMVVHPAVGNKNHTLVNALLYHFHKLSNQDSIRPGIVHRLDKDTSGLMIVAKCDEVHEKLAVMIQQKEVERIYEALVWGVVHHDRGTIDAPIGRDPFHRQQYCVTDVHSKHAVTHFRVLKRFQKATLLECKLETGRTHQIRVHMSYISHPIVNDAVYGKKGKTTNFGQMLHSKILRFTHPITQEKLEFYSEIPQAMKDAITSFEG